jgi:dihydroxyacetone kinase
MELGLGIHGEAGAERLPPRDAAAVVDLMVTRLLQHMPEPANVSAEEASPRPDRLALMLNNLGG